MAHFILGWLILSIPFALGVGAFIKAGKGKR